MHPKWYDPIGRIGVRPDPATQDPDAVEAQRPRGSRRPHTDAKVTRVRHLIEETTLTYGEIAAKTGVGRASICRWTLDLGWKRPLFAPRATDRLPTARASAKLRRRTLASRLAALAERHIRELEDSACVDPDKLAEALELYKMAKLAALPRHGPRLRGRKAAEAEAQGMYWDQSFAAPARDVVRALRAAGVDTARAPEQALNDFIDSRAPPPGRSASESERMFLRARRSSRRFTREDEHREMLKKEGEQNQVECSEGRSEVAPVARKSN